MLNRYSRICLTLLITALLCCGCATSQYMKLAPVDNGAQKIVNAKGKQTLISEKKLFVSLAPYKSQIHTSEDTPYLLHVDNLTNEPVKISSKNVRVKLKATSSTDELSEQEIAVLSYNDLMRQVEQEAKDQRRKAERGSKVPTSVDNSRNMLDDTQSAVVDGHKPFEAAEDQDDEIRNKMVAEKLEATFKKLNKKRQFIKRRVMKPKTIAAGQTHGGLIVTDTRSLDSQVEGVFEIVVSIGGEQHTFLISRTPDINGK